MLQPKFIITMEGYFRLGMVNQHKELLQPGDQCLGGGYYHFDYVSNRLLLSGFSYDFGTPKWHLIDTLHIPAVYRGLRLIYQYNDGEHDDLNLMEQPFDYYD